MDVSISHPKWKLLVRKINFNLQTHTHTINFKTNLKNTTSNKIERFPHKPYFVGGQPHNVTSLVFANDVSFNCTPMADLEPYIRWFYHNASIGNVGDENFLNGTLVQVPNAKHFGNR